VIKNIFANTDSQKGSKIWDDLLFVLTEKHKKGEVYFEPSLTPHLNGMLDQGEVAIEVLAPNQYLAGKGPGSTDRKGRKLTSNSISAVIRLNHNQKPIVILPGDIDKVGLDNLLEENPNLQSWLAIFPHHGGTPSAGNIERFTTDFCDSVKPDIVVFSITDNEKDFPNNEVVQVIANRFVNIRMLSTRSSGVLLQHINSCKDSHHYNCTGNISIIFGEYPPTIKWTNPPKLN
jgi:hypothetical protein